MQTPKYIRKCEYSSNKGENQYKPMQKKPSEKTIYFQKIKQ